jgi:hypothetical protein
LRREISMSLTRRFVLALPMAFAAVHARAVLRPLAASVPDTTAAAAAADCLRALVPAPDSARLIGRAYLAGCPNEVGDDARLARLILADPGGPESASRADAPMPADTRSLRETIATRVREDFRHGRTATVDGWILSRTEARLCALWA